MHPTIMSDQKTKRLSLAKIIMHSMKVHSSTSEKDEPDKGDFDDGQKFKIFLGSTEKIKWHHNNKMYHKRYIGEL